MRKVDPARHHGRRRQIADAAAVLFATRGYDGTTTAAICEAAGTSTGNLFHYFSSKREIFAAIVADTDDDGTATQLAAAQASDDPWAGLLGFVEHLATPAAVPHVPALVLEAMLQANRDPELADLLERNSAGEQAGIAALLARAADTGAVDPAIEPERAAAWIMALVNALYLQAAFDDRFDPTAELPTMLLILRRYLRPPAG